MSKRAFHSKEIIRAAMGAASEVRLYSLADKRKRRRAHRTAARSLIRGGTLFNARAPVGSIPWEAAQWHLKQARKI